MRNLFKKHTEDVSRTIPGYEETERRTPTVGIILLIFMFIAGIYFGLYAMDDLSNIPERPADLSSCAALYQTNSDGQLIYGTRPAALLKDDLIRSLAYERSQDCVLRLSSRETATNIPALYEQRIAIEQRVVPVVTEYLKLEASTNDLHAQIDQATGAYGVGLQEQQAGVAKPVFPVAPAQQTIGQLRQQEAPMVARMNELQQQVDAFRPALDAIDAQLVEAYKPVFETYTHDMKWYEFKVFLLQFLLIIPFFLLALRKYLELYRKSSPYTVIFTTIVAVLGFLLLKTTLYWFWGLFLQEILRVLIEWFGKYDILRSLLFYVGMFLSFAIFGGAVYMLQKRIFDPRRVTIRRFRAKQCPQCQTDLDLADMYCPNCGAHTRELCSKCGKERFVGLPFCPHCGDNKGVNH